MLLFFLLFNLMFFPFSNQEDTTWQEFTSQEGNFAVLMPGTPTKQEPVSAGGLEVHNYTALQNGTAYVVGYNLFSVNLLKQLTIEQTLDFVVKGMIGQANGKLISSSNIKLQNYAGKEIKIEGNNLFFQGQIFVVKQRVYYVLVASKTDPSSIKENKMFFSSFRLLSMLANEEKLPEPELTLNKLSSEAGNFSIDIPGKPQFITLPTTLVNNKLNIFSFSTSTPSVVYAVSYFDLPKEVIVKNVAKIFFDAIRDSTTIKDNSKVIEESSINFEKHSGRFFKLKKNTGAIINTKLYLVNQRLYIISVTMVDGQETKSELADKFLNSFELLGADFDDPFEDNQPTIGGVPKSSQTTNPLTEPSESTSNSSENNKSIEKLEDLVKRDESVLRGKAIEHPSPEYPIEAKKQRVEDDVIVRIIVDKDGKVARAKVISGAAVFHEAAIKVAKTWRFNPSLLNNKPVRIVGDLTFRFKLS